MSAAQGPDDIARLVEGPRQRYGMLLIATLAAFFVQGIASPERWGQFIVVLLLSFTLMLALSVANARRQVIRAMLIIVAVVCALSLIEAIEGSVQQGPTRIVTALLVGLAPPAVIVSVVRNLRSKETVTIEAVLGVISVYILVGMLFAQVYGAIDRLGGAPFFDQGGAATVTRCLYFSFTTLTTTGYGDLTARTNLGHTLSVTEALLGQIYLVTIVSLLVGNLGRRPVRRQRAAGEHQD